MIGIVIVDPQIDFFPGGALGVNDGDAIVDPINHLLEQHPKAPVFVTRDWHPETTCHFKAGGGLWPPHCIEQTPGAAIHPDLNLPESAVLVSKGQDPEDDGGYSGFEGVTEDGKSLLEVLRAHEVDEVIVCGLATDFCVKATVLDALNAEFPVHLFAEGIRAVNLEEGDGERAIEEMLNAGARLLPG